MSATHQAGRFLLIRSGARVVALPLANVRETMRPLPLEAILGSPDYLLGICVIRGAPTPVVDASLLLSGQPAAGEARTAARFVTLNVGARAAALAVDAVLDVTSLSPGQLNDVPPLLRGASAERVSAMGALDQQLLVVLDTARLLPQSLWSLLVTRGGTA